MTNANIVMIEDDELTRCMMRLQMVGAGHIVTGEAATREDALSLINEVALGRIACDIITLDGNLGEPDKDCADALAIATQARAQHVSAVIIGMSSYSLTERGVPVDLDLTKSHIGQLAATVNELVLPNLSRAA
ncbi:MAG: hypothetical protein JWL89_551 [Candidatus Saccharibacteria bacterium]|nr:hypothetical protein [Candidatus Saccharibacteria bacterium]